MCDPWLVMDGEISFAGTLQTGCEQSKSAIVKDREEDAAVIEKCHTRLGFPGRSALKIHSGPVGCPLL